MPELHPMLRLCRRLMQWVNVAVQHPTPGDPRVTIYVEDDADVLWLCLCLNLGDGWGDVVYRNTLYLPYQVVREPRPSDRSPSGPMGLRISPPSRLISCLGPQSLACIGDPRTSVATAVNYANAYSRNNPTTTYHIVDDDDMVLHTVLNGVVTDGLTDTPTETPVPITTTEAPRPGRFRAECEVDGVGWEPCSGRLHPTEQEARDEALATEHSDCRIVDTADDDVVVIATYQGGEEVIPAARQRPERRPPPAPPTPAPAYEIQRAATLDIANQRLPRGGEAIAIDSMLYWSQTHPLRWYQVVDRANDEVALAVAHGGSLVEQEPERTFTENGQQILPDVPDLPDYAQMAADIEAAVTEGFTNGEPIVLTPQATASDPTMPARYEITVRQIREVTFEMWVDGRGVSQAERAAACGRAEAEDNWQSVTSRVTDISQVR